jgi:hypothetical protein
VRVTFLDRNGRLLGDDEAAGTGTGASTSTFPIPAGCGAVAVTGLGHVGAASRGGLGAVSFSAASQGQCAVAGWQAGNLMPQVNSSTFLGRASCVILAQPSLSRKGKQRTAQGMVRLSQAVVDQSGVETWLPVSVGVVGLILDQRDPTAASSGDLAIAVSGAVVAAPAQVTGGVRKILLYDVTKVSAADHIVVAVASQSGSRLSGIVGLPGRAQEWAVRWNGGIPEHIVPDGPLTSDGSVVVTISAPLPAVTGLSPATGGTGGGTPVGIMGWNVELGSSFGHDDLGDRFGDEYHRRCIAATRSCESAGGLAPDETAGWQLTGGHIVRRCAASPTHARCVVGCHCCV